MELLLSIALGVVTACGVYLMLRGRTFPLVLGLSLVSYAVNVFIFAMGRLVAGAPPLVKDGAAGYTDPLPQALVLTAIVIGFGMTGFLMELALRSAHDTGTDHVDGREDAAPAQKERGP
jgi:multicomponent K+:H+ antiporter subunit C